MGLILPASGLHEWEVVLHNFKLDTFMLSCMALSFLSSVGVCCCLYAVYLLTLYLYFLRPHFTIFRLPNRHIYSCNHSETVVKPTQIQKSRLRGTINGYLAAGTYFRMFCFSICALTAASLHLNMHT